MLSSTSKKPCCLYHKRTKAALFQTVTQPVSHLPFLKAVKSFTSQFITFSSPFHIRMQVPLAKSSKVTRPKSSVTPANILQGDRQIDSPWRRESGRPNLDDKRFMPLCYLLGSFAFTQWTGYLIPNGVAGSTLGFCFWTASSSFLFLFHPNHPLRG